MEKESPVKRTTTQKLFGGMPTRWQVRNQQKEKQPKGKGNYNKREGATQPKSDCFSDGASECRDEQASSEGK